jgi:hypothetical protein
MRNHQHIFFFKIIDIYTTILKIYVCAYFKYGDRNNGNITSAAEQRGVTLTLRHSAAGVEFSLYCSYTELSSLSVIFLCYQQ